MSNRTFFVLLVSVLMLLGGVSTLMMKKDMPIRQETADAAAYGQKLEIEEAADVLLLPEKAEIVEGYGAVYSEEYGQWSVCEEMYLKTKTGSSIYAPLSGVVKKIENVGAEDLMISTGSRITIECGEANVSIYPVYGVCVFAGSNVTRENLLGTAREQLYICAQKGGRAIDPMSLTTDE